MEVTVVAVEALEWVLAQHAAGHPDGVVRVNEPLLQGGHAGLVGYLPGNPAPVVLYPPGV